MQIIHEEYNKICINCQTTFSATRIDKKFCSIKCRSRFHNAVAKKNYVPKNTQNPVFSKTNATLLSNYKILKQFINKTVKIEVLVNHGFKLDYITQFEYKEDRQKTIFLCYDIGFEYQDKENLIIFFKH